MYTYSKRVVADAAFRNDLSRGACLDATLRSGCRPSSRIGVTHFFWSQLATLARRCRGRAVNVNVVVSHARGAKRWNQLAPWLVAVAAFASTSNSRAAQVPEQAAPSAHSEVATMRGAFNSPPQSTRPLAYWFWMGGNVNAEGVQQGLAWMHRVGIGGVMVFNTDIFSPLLIKDPAYYMTPAWKRAFSLTAQLTRQYGMSLTTTSAPGWGMEGGPWVHPEQSMKKLVWSTTAVTGGRPFDGTLTAPPSNTGLFQDAPAVTVPPSIANLKFYRDAAVVAYRAPVLDPTPISGTADGKEIGARGLAELSDGSLANGITLSPSSNGERTIELRYQSAVRLQGITLAASDSLSTNVVKATVSTSVDGRHWQEVVPRMYVGTEVDLNGRRFPQATVAFAPVVAQWARVTLSAGAFPESTVPGSDLAASPGTYTGAEIIAERQREAQEKGSASGNHDATTNTMVALPGDMATAHGPASYHVQELVLHTRATVNRFAPKAYFSIVEDYRPLETRVPTVPGTAIDPKNVIDLTRNMTPDGRLHWTPPPGQWVVLRMGYSLLGTTNHPAPLQDTGLEVDKLSAKYTAEYMDHYLGAYEKLLGPLGKPGSLTGFENDSTEVGAQNWTDNMISDFHEVAGYSLLPWLPALAGAVVGDRAQTDRFLWDFRRVIDHLVATKFYKTTADVAHRRSLFTYSEAIEYARVSIGDDMQMRQYADCPMGAMWLWGRYGRPFPTYVADVAGARSVSDLYGKKLVCAESMTSTGLPWAMAPRQLKAAMNEEFTMGVNRPVISQAVLQPFEKGPGLSVFNAGSYFNRLNTWAEYAEPWITYMARSSLMLQTGRHVADIAYYYGEGAPLTALFARQSIDVPHGYGFDFVNAPALLNLLTVDHGELVTPSGMRFRVLYLGPHSQHATTLKVLRRVDQLVRQGATVIGARPLASPSLADDQATFQALAAVLFGSTEQVNERRVGEGKVYPTASLRDGLEAMRLQPDFSYIGKDGQADLGFTDRVISQGRGHIYFVANRLERTSRVDASFRVTGMVPELWNPVTGETTPASYRAIDGRTEVPLDLPAFGSTFVVFHGTTTVAERDVRPPEETTIETLQGPWQVSFEAGRGAPASVTMPVLQSWTDSPSDGVKYFSGTAKYAREFSVSKVSTDATLWVDLGEVRDIARVIVNGVPAGITWCPPFVVDITKYVRPGANTLEVEVANVWANRLIGDAQPDAKEKYTFTWVPTYRADAPLLGSGLLGPVRIQRRLAPSPDVRTAARRTQQ